MKHSIRFLNFSSEFCTKCSVKLFFGDEGLFPEKSANFDWSGDDCHNLGNLWLTTMRLVLSWQLIARKDVSKRPFLK